MKSSLVPISCGTALALMAGAVAAHWGSVRDMSTLAAAIPADPQVNPVNPVVLPDDGLAREAKGLIADVRRNHEAPVASQRTAVASSNEGSDARIERLLNVLEGTVEQNQELRDRIADTNRDLLELRFQVDSYDGQFRPLRVEQEPNYYDDGSSGVLPPLETP